MKKHLANILTVFRIFLGSIMLWYGEITSGFLKLFCVAGITDLLDGPIARLTKSVSELGSKLDTTADVILYVAIAKILLFKKKIKRKYIVVIVCAMVALLISAFIGLKRFGSFFFIHTFTGKLLGFNCFLLPFSCISNTLDYLSVIICFLFVLHATESIVIQLKSNMPSPNTRSIFAINK